MNFFSTVQGLEPSLWSAYVVPWVIFLVSAFLLIKYQDRIRTSPYERPIRIAITIWAIGMELFFWRWVFKGQANANWYDYFVTNTMFPFQACATSLWLMIFCSLTNNVKVFKIFFFMAIIGPLVTLVAGDAGYGFDRFRYYHYYLVHMFTLLMAIHLLVYNQVTFTPKDFRNVTIYIVVYAAIAVPLNVIFGSNFLFLYNAHESPLVDLPKWLSSTIMIVVFFTVTTALYFGVNTLQPKRQERTTKGTVVSE